MTKFGFIGMGNMGQALLIAMEKYAGIETENVFAYAPNQEKLRKNAELFGFTPCASLKELVLSADTVVFACKPYQLDDVLTEIKDELKDKTTFSIAAGWDFEKFESYGIRAQYIMPNTPVQVGEGVILVEDKYNIEEAEREKLLEMLSKFSKVIEMPAHLIDAASAISGCAPAFADMFIEGLSDGAVKNGVPRKMSYEIITQMMIGAAKLMQETGKHPGELKDQVCSPGGTTIRGVHALEKRGMRSALIDAVDKVCGK